MAHDANDGWSPEFDAGKMSWEVPRVVFSWSQASEEPMPKGKGKGKGKSYELELDYWGPPPSKAGAFESLMAGGAGQRQGQGRQGQLG